MSIIAAMQPVLEQALLGDAALAALIGDSGVYSAIAPKDAALPFVVLGAASEADYPRFSRAGSEDTETVTGYSQFKDKLQAAEMWSHLRRLLNRRKFTLADGSTAYTRIILLTLDNDPSGVARCVAQLRAVAL